MCHISKHNLTTYTTHMCSKKNMTKHCLFLVLSLLSRTFLLSAELSFFPAVLHTFSIFLFSFSPCVLPPFHFSLSLNPRSFLLSSFLLSPVPRCNPVFLYSFCPCSSLLFLLDKQVSREIASCTISTSVVGQERIKKKVVNVLIKEMCLISVINIVPYPSLRRASTFLVQTVKMRYHCSLNQTLLYLLRNSSLTSTALELNRA